MMRRVVLAATVLFWLGVGWFGWSAWRAEAPYEKLEPFHPTEGSPAASTPATAQ